MNTIMDRNKVVSIATELLIHKRISQQDAIYLLDSYCTEKKKERKYIDSFIKTIVQLPYIMYCNYVTISLEYYMIKYAIHILKEGNNLNSIYNRNTKENILLIY